MLFRIKPFFLFLLFCAGTLTVLAQNFTSPMFIPPLDTGGLLGPKSRIYELEPEEGSHRFAPNGNLYETAGFNGMGYLGPTLLWRTGDSITMSVHNHLHHSTTVHWHGAHVPPYADGGPHDSIVEDGIWAPRFKVMDRTETMWYHPHLHHHTLEQVNKGLAAMIIVKNPDDPYEALLPHTYGVDDFPIIVQDKDLSADTINTSCTMGATFLVNGTINPVLEVPAQQVRFRILNAGSERVFSLAFSDGTNFNVIATDAGYTAKPLENDTVIIGTGERTEWVMDFTGRGGEELYLLNAPANLERSIPGGPIPGATPSCYKINYVDSFSVNMLKIKIIPPTATPIYTLPIAFAPLQIPNINDVSVERTKKLVFYNPTPNSAPFSIDSTSFDLAVINDIILLDNIEIWKIVNVSRVAHPFHIHDISFHILDMHTVGPNPQPIPIPSYLQGPKDVVLVPDSTEIRFITKFTDFATSVDPSNGYMYHCHILAHEDDGMMHQFVVTTDLSNSNEPNLVEHDWSIFPNPSSGALNLKGTCKEESKVFIYNLLGQRVAQYQLPPIVSGQSVTLSKTLPDGSYIIHWERPDGTSSKKWIIRRDK